MRKIEYKEAIDFLLPRHYSGRKPTVSYAFGYFEDNVLKAVCTFGKPASNSLCIGVCGKEYSSNVYELNRLCVDGSIKIQLSEFLSFCLRELKQYNMIIVSYADKQMNHNGYIYQATNFIYTGTSSNTYQYVDENGEEFHFRNIGHYQKNNKLNVSLVKRRLDEENINKIEIANYLRKYKGNYTAKQIDKLYNYKDTSAHWFRVDAGFSFPNVNDWIKLKNILNFDNTYDDIMTSYKLVPDSSEIIKKLNLTKQNIYGKHRYIYFNANKNDKKKFLKAFKLNKESYPKEKNQRYENNTDIGGQMLLI